VTDVLLLESGDALLLESGDETLLESSVASAASTPAVFAPDFGSALLRSHTIVVACDVLQRGVPVMLGLPVISGDVQISARQLRRRTCRVAIADRDGSLTPRTMRDLLAPLSTELRLRRGVRYPDGSEEVYDLGVFRVDDDDISFQGGTISITGFDRSIKVSRNKWLRPYTIAAGTLVTDALVAMINDRYPGLVHNVAASDIEVAAEVVYGQNTGNDPWADMQEVGLSAGLDVYFDAQGIWTAQPYPQLASAPAAASYVDGEGGTVVDGSRQMSGGDIKNGVLVYGENAAGEIIVGQAWDMDPASPTYAGDPIGTSDFGARPYTYENSRAITHQQQADEAAAAILSRLDGLGDGVSFTALPDPRRDAEEVAHVRSLRAGVDSRYIADTVGMPLGPEGQMSVATRAQRAA
jgi:hypothetical protein